jgi:hypothetical protein
MDASTKPKHGADVRRRDLSVDVPPYVTSGRNATASRR